MQVRVGLNHVGWFVLLVLSIVKVTAQVSRCPTPDSVWIPSSVTSGINGMSVNFSVECSEDVVKLILSSGGIHVTTLKVLQECVEYNGTENGSDTDPQVSEILYETYNHLPSYEPHQGEFLISIDPSVTAGMVCSYNGCYESDGYLYDLAYHLTFTASSKCTFTERRIQASSLMVLPHTATYSHVTTINTVSFLSPTTTTLFVNRIPLSSVMEPRLQATHVSDFRNELLSTKSSDTSSPPLLITATVRSEQWAFHANSETTHSTTKFETTIAEGSLQSSTLLWITIAFIFPCIVVMLLLFSCICFMRRKSILRQKFSSDKVEWIMYYDANEPIDYGFFPVLVDLPPLMRSYSKQSVVTKLDQLDCLYSPTNNHSTSNSVLGETLSSDTSTNHENTNSLLGSYSECDCDEGEQNINKHNDRQHLSSGQPKHTSNRLLDTNELKNFTFQSVYRSNCSLGSSDYVQMSSLHCTSCTSGCSCMSTTSYSTMTDESPMFSACTFSETPTDNQ